MLLFMRAKELREAAHMIAECKELEEWNMCDLVLHMAEDQKRRLDDLRAFETRPG